MADPYQNYSPQPPPSRSLNVYALLSLVLGLTVFPPLGIIFGRKAKAQIAVTGESGIELAKVGEIVGWIFSGLYVVGCCGWLIFMSSMFVAS